VDIVLTDIMMPEMDGYETIGAIRQIPDFETLPIIALTAKAMKGDREKCMLAGASDYVTKPVDVDYLYSVMRVCISRRHEHSILRTGPAPEIAQADDLFIDDDRNSIRPGDPVLLIVEDDVTFARILVDVARERGLKALVTLRGSAALSMAREFQPRAVTLDIQLPDISGWTLLDLLKHDKATRHIPVHILTAHDDARRGFALGAIHCRQKEGVNESLRQAFDIVCQSIQSRVKRVLVVCSDKKRRASLLQSVQGPDLEILLAEDAAEVNQASGAALLDAVIIDLKFTAMNPIQLAETLQANSSLLMLPVVLFATGKLTEAQRSAIETLTASNPVRYAGSPGRVLDLTMLLLHRKEDDLSADQKRLLAQVNQNDPMLVNKTVLVVDDDLRNIFALTSLLENRGLKVLHAENGRAGIDQLRRRPDVDAVLMDIMMPGMDGYEATRTIRQIPEFESLPIIALTAKAMKGDREKCLRAGASDYVTKPVDVEQLFSVMRVSIAQRAGSVHESAPVAE
jgi:CheY-like chemotaxis protein